MTPRQLAFVREYLVDRNATQAMIRAGYSARTANKHAPRLMQHRQVRRLIDRAIADRDCQVRVEAVAMLEGMATDAKSELQSARDHLVATGKRLNSVTRAIRDIERLCMPLPVDRTAEPMPTQGPPRVAERTNTRAAPAQTYQPILPPFPEQQAFAAMDYTPTE